MKASKTIDVECCGNHYNILGGKEIIVKEVNRLEKIEVIAKVLDWMVRFSCSSKA